MSTDSEWRRCEYDQVNENIRSLAEIRFKLLALLPAITAIGAAVIVERLLDSFASLALSLTTLIAIGFVSLIGLVSTLGIVLYDQRNSELYNALIHRAKELEKELKLKPSPGIIDLKERGGQWNERPAKHRRVILQAGHDSALALIYGASLGAWVFLLAFAVVGALDANQSRAILMAVTLAIGTALVAMIWLHVLDLDDRHLYSLGHQRDKSNARDTSG